jgi:MFS family permease
MSARRPTSEDPGMTQTEAQTDSTAAAPRLTAAYWRLWWAAGINNVGNGAFAAALPLLAVALTRNPLLVSAVAASTYLPWLLLSFPAGALVDRHDRAVVMSRAQTLQAVIVGAVAVLVAIHRMDIAILIIAAFCLGAGEVVFGNASQAILPDIVAKPLLYRANGAQQTVTILGQQFAGPPTGSLLIALAKALPFGLDAVSFAVSSALLGTLPRTSRPGADHPPMRAAITDGLRWLRRHRLLRTLAMLVGVNNFCGQLGWATLVLLATQTLHLSTRGFGILLSGAAVGSLLGSLVNARIVKAIGPLPALFTSLTVNVAVFLAMGASPNAVVLGALMAANGFVTMLWNIVTVSLRQDIVPSELLGRVNSVYRMLSWGLIPLGALAGGLVAHEFGLRAPYPVAGALRGIALLFAAPVLIRAMRDHVAS